MHGLPDNQIAGQSEVGGQVEEKQVNQGLKDWSP